ncbi:MAG: TonB-dependent receptor [Bacteroidetes bacterium]|nr:TonB-dependent receptor [Bacteroidota bacterium]
MKRNRLLAGLLLLPFLSFAQAEKKDSFYVLSPVEIQAVRAGDEAPFAKSNLTRSDIEKRNLGQDLPFLLSTLPGVVVHSDAGNGIGYTGIRIRGTDPTRINMTLNGIPYNDAESQGIFFVNLPDLASSAQSIQVQRGVGTSSNGAGAFGANLNISTHEVNPQRRLSFQNSYGSFDSRKYTLLYQSGLEGNFATDIRLSHLFSNGYIDRASSRLSSYYVSTVFVQPSYSLRITHFAGKEKTYQAWYGISEADLRDGNRRVNDAGTERPGSPYENETDNYRQSHTQLFFNRTTAGKAELSIALFYTRGNGYYEQYKANQDYARYQMPYPINGNDTTFTTDLIRQLWLDNHFFGTTFSYQWKEGRSSWIGGGALMRYIGRHFGKPIWALNGLTAIRNWYDQPADKNDANQFLKWQWNWKPKWSLFADLQLRWVEYRLNGFRNNPQVRFHPTYRFVNPKAGISYAHQSWSGFASLAVAQKEPNRDDFEAGWNQPPHPEKLLDLEMNIGKKKSTYRWSATLYHMAYRDQLILTGAINDVGAYTRQNIPRSYRMGIEWEGSLNLRPTIRLTGNVAVSRNRVKNFTKYVDDYDNGGQLKRVYRRSDLALSPTWVSNGILSWTPIKGLECQWISQFVSRQYLDNTAQKSRSLDPYWIQHLLIDYRWVLPKEKSIRLTLQVNNLFDIRYEPNGYTFSYFYGGRMNTENYYFPMAGTNGSLGVQIEL